MPYTVVSFHAHPDDEALLTAGTLARAAAEGHRVVLVCATDGALGLVAPEFPGSAGGELAERRRTELEGAATAIGAAAVHFLGYGDSGLHGENPGGFAGSDPEAAAARLARILRAERADVVTVYDPAGGYGHPDHVQVHRVGHRAAEMAGTPVVLEATVDRRPLVRALRVLGRLGVLAALGVDRSEWSAERFTTAFADPHLITHRVDVRRFAAAKRAAMAAHASQGTGDSAVRTLAVFVRLPRPLFGRVFGHEWFVERGRRAGPAALDDIFESLRGDRADPDRVGWRS